LFLLAHAEAELLDSKKVDFSILAMHIPKAGQPLDSPIKLFFIIWMETLGLDRKKMLSGEYLHWGSEENDDSSEDETVDDDIKEAMSTDALAKQFQRYFNKGTKPKWLTIDKWANDLRPIASNKQSRIGAEGYTAAAKFIYGGVLILNQLFEEGLKVYPEERLLQILSTYEEHVEKHFTSMKKGADETSTPRS
jgi:hypothetical protein